MKAQTLRFSYSIVQLLSDIILIVASYVLAFRLRVAIPWPDELKPEIQLSAYYGLIVTLVVCIVAVLFTKRQYYVPRAPSRVDQFYAVIVGVTLGTLFAIAFATFLFKDNVVIVDFSRAMVIYSWLIGIVLLTIGRSLNQAMRDWLRSRGVGKDRLLVVGTGDVARIVLQRILWSPRLGYEVVGIVDEERSMRRLLGVPIIGKPAELPDLIDRHDIDEVLIAIPDKGHREVVKVVSYCQRGRVSIKVFPDIFQFITSEATIDELGGLPLLTVRDYALRGYLLFFKRLLDIVFSGLGLIVLSPFMLLVAVAIKLESPGGVFYIQERMGLDAKPFKILKFRSMRKGSDKDKPGWTVGDDPRRTRLGHFIRSANVDELPQLINVFLGEMSLVGPRPEQPFYVNSFRKTVPDYMSRHLAKAGMTGWAQINGLRGDTSIVERTKFDIWYIEHWSLLLDLKIIVRTVWQTLIGHSEGAG